MSKILVVDDNQFMRKRISKVLAGEGYEVVEAEDGIEALTCIRQADPAANVIMLTALNQQETVVKAIQLGAKDFLTKPVVPDQLMAALQKVLR